MIKHMDPAMTKLSATFSLLAAFLPSLPSKTPANGEAACLQEVAALPAAAGSGRVFFADSTVGWLVDGNRLWRTLDGGRTWTPIHLPTPPRGHSTGLLDSHFFDAFRGWVRFAEAAFTTADAGRSWSTRPLPTASHSDLRTVWFADDGQRGWVGGAQYLPTRQRPLYLPDWLAYEGEPGVWMVAKAILQHTADGGAHWSTQSLPVREPAVLLSVAFHDGEFGFAFSQNSTFVTSDGGRNWIAGQFPEDTVDAGFRTSGTWPRAIFFLNSREGWLSFQDGYLFRTHNGGHTWAEILRAGRLRSPFAGYGTTLFRIQFTSMNQGWAVDGPGSLHRTEDGGATWSVVPIKGRVRDLSFTDEGTGWVMTDTTLYRVVPAPTGKCPGS
jgi:photosystem II stability/assembly factor-like uncharacterized protein